MRTAKTSTAIPRKIRTHSANTTNLSIPRPISRTISQTVLQTGMSRRQLYRLAAAGKIIFRKSGRSDAGGLGFSRALLRKPSSSSDTTGTAAPEDLYHRPRKSRCSRVQRRRSNALLGQHPCPAWVGQVAFSTGDRRTFSRRSHSFGFPKNQLERTECIASLACRDEPQADAAIIRRHPLPPLASDPFSSRPVRPTIMAACWYALPNRLTHLCVIRPLFPRPLPAVARRAAVVAPGPATGSHGTGGGSCPHWPHPARTPG